MWREQVTEFCPLPEPPYYAVIFANQSSSDMLGYSEMAEMMDRLSAEQPGFIGRDSTRNENGFSITVSYWKDEASIANWRENLRHAAAQSMGKQKWYSHYTLRVAKVERHYEGPEGR